MGFGFCFLFQETYGVKGYFTDEHAIAAVIFSQPYKILILIFRPDVDGIEATVTLNVKQGGMSRCLRPLLSLTRLYPHLCLSLCLRLYCSLSFAFFFSHSRLTETVYDYRFDVLIQTYDPSKSTGFIVFLLIISID
jgi:hypothetical protein